MKSLISIIVLLCVVIPSAFAEQSMDGMDMHSNNAQATHQGTGKVISVDKAKLTVKLVHEAIKSLGWPRMTMNFKVAESSILAELKAGDVVTFELGMEANTDKWQINRITPLKK